MVMKEPETERAGVEIHIVCGRSSAGMEVEGVVEKTKVESDMLVVWEEKVKAVNVDDIEKEDIAAVDIEEERVMVVKEAVKVIKEAVKEEEIEK